MWFLPTAVLIVYEPHDLIRFAREEARIALETDAASLTLASWWWFGIGYLTGQAFPLGIF